MADANANPLAFLGDTFVNAEGKEVSLAEVAAYKVVIVLYSADW